MKFVWHKIWHSNEIYSTNCDNLDTLIKDFSEIAEEVGLGNVDPVGIPEVIESHSQPLSNEKLYDLTQQLTEEGKGNEEEKDRETKEMQTKDLTDILSAIHMVAEKLCDVVPDCERSSTVTRGIRYETCYTLIIKSCKKIRKNQNSERYILFLCILNQIVLVL
jgi:hypothetical protein